MSEDTTHTAPDINHIRSSGGEFPRVTAIAELGEYQGRNGSMYRTWDVHDDHDWFSHSGRTADWLGVWDYTSGALRQMPVGKVVRITIEVRDEDQPEPDE